MLLVLFALILLAATMLILFVDACRGVRIDDHPICTRCGFDLFGLPTTSDRCSECGATFIRGKGRIGHRRRRPRALVMRGLRLVISLGLLAVGIAFARDQIDWQARAPVWLLKSEALGMVSMDRARAAGELDQRFVGGSLSDSQVRDLCSQFLRVQIDQPHHWEWEMGNFIHHARAAGRISDADWNQYLMNVPVVRFDVPSSVKRGEALAIRVRLGADRCGLCLPLHERVELLAEIPELYTTEMESDVVRPGEAPRPNPVVGCVETIYRSPGRDEFIGWNIKPASLATLASGSHSITLHVDCETSDGHVAQRQRYAIQAQWWLNDR